MSNQLMNPCKSANHFVELLSCILTNRTKFTYISQTMYQLVCKLFIFSFSCLQTIYLGSFDFANNFFGIFHPPPLSKKIMVRPLERPTGVRKVMGSIPVGDSDFFFVPRSRQRHVDYSIFSIIIIIFQFLLLRHRPLSWQQNV